MKKKVAWILIYIVALIWSFLNVVYAWNNQPEEMTLEEKIRYEQMIW